MASIHLTKNNFEKEVLQSDVPVLVDFWATWCGPCRMVAPSIEQLSDEVSASAKVAKVDIDECKAIAEKYNVASIPTFIVFKNGEPVKREMGAMPKAKLAEMLK